MTTYKEELESLRHTKYEIEKQIKEKEELIAKEEKPESNLLKKEDFFTLLAGNVIAITVAGSKNNHLTEFAIRIDPYVYVFKINDVICMTNGEWINKGDKND
jgi:hypothetical protein